MKIPQYRISYTAPGGSAQDVADARGIKIKFGIDAIKDTFEVTLSDKDENKNFELNGVIQIYLHDLGDSEVLVMDGVISRIGNTMDEKQNRIILKGNNRLEILLNHQVRADFPASDAKSASDIIQNLLQQASQNQPTAKQITWASGNDTTTKVIEFFSEYRPAYALIEQLSSDQYTGNGQYIFYLDQTSGEFVWLERPSTVAGTIDYGSGVISLRRDRDADESVNFLIINAGKDLNDASIHTFQTNESSIGSLGFRTKYEVRQEYAQFVILKNPGFDNDAVRTAVKQLAKDRAKIIMDKFSDGIDKINIVINGSTSFTAGQQYDIAMPNAGYTTAVPKRLRLMEVEQNYSSKGWMTILSFKEELI